MTDIINTDDKELIAEWQGLSELLYRARYYRDVAEFNDRLRQQIENNPDSPLAPIQLFWIGENLTYTVHNREAIDIYSELADRYPEHQFGGQSWAAKAIVKRSICYEKLNEPENAINSYRELLDADEIVRGTSRSWLHYRIGKVAEYQGNDYEAIENYIIAAEIEEEVVDDEVDIQDLSMRNAKRLASSREWVRPQYELVVNELAQALREQDADRLKDLASPTHFTLGRAYSDRVFDDTDRVLELFMADLFQSEVRVDASAAQCHGEKCYLSTYGWQGGVFKGQVICVITRLRDGWEWSGVALTQPPEDSVALFGEIERRENQPLGLSIKAPWPSGQHFRAGWSVGMFDECGAGLGGLYYNKPDTHTPKYFDAFAIDFSRNNLLIPASDGIPVLAVQNGFVSRMVDWATDGETVTANRVQIDHRTVEEQQQGIPARYTSHYLHLGGPNQILVVESQWVQQGYILGNMDDTGRSVFSHLHFSIHDRNMGGHSVRPTPMDGQSLNDNEDGKCIVSSNMPITPP